MRIRVGYLDQTWGTIADNGEGVEDGGLRYRGQVGKLRAITKALRAPDETDAEFLASLVHRLHGYNWAQDTAQDQPEQQFAEPADADGGAIRLYGHPPGYSQNRSRNGQWAPGDGGEHEHEAAGHGGSGGIRGPAGEVHERAKGSAGGGAKAGGVTVEYTNERYRVAIEGYLGGRAISDEDLAALMGAQPGSRVVVGAGAQVSVHGPNDEYVATRNFLPAHEPGEQVGIFNNTYARNGDETVPADEHVTAMMRTQIEAAQRLGVVQYLRIKSRHDTHDSWDMARRGYNAEIDAHLMTETKVGQFGSLPRGVGRARTLQDLLSTRVGARWWFRNGSNPGLTFDLTPGSQSMRTWEAYLRTHNPVKELRRAAGRRRAQHGGA